MGYQRDQHLLLLEPEGMLVPSLHADLLKQQQLAIEKKLEDFELEAWLLGHFVGQLGAVWADGSIGYIAIEPIIRVVWRLAVAVDKVWNVFFFPTRCE